MNCIFWTERYPRLVTKEDVQALYGTNGRARLKLIGDISADIEGAVECTVRQTGPGDPVYVYAAATGEVVSGVAGDGPVIFAVEALPAEFPREASETFSQALEPFAPALARADYTVPFAELDLPPEVKRAVIAHRGRLVPEYAYIEEYLDLHKS
jgi:alpha-aminoadipic semialdehyde synthase